MGVIVKYFSLILYYSFAQFLPASTNSYFRWCRSIRRFCVKRCFEFCGKDVNVEKGAKFGTGGEFILVMVLVLALTVRYMVLSL